MPMRCERKVHIVALGMYIFAKELNAIVYSQGNRNNNRKKQFEIYTQLLHCTSVLIWLLYYCMY